MRSLISDVARGNTRRRRRYRARLYYVRLRRARVIRDSEESPKGWYSVRCRLRGPIRGDANIHGAVFLRDRQYRVIVALRCTRNERSRLTSYRDDRQSRGTRILRRGHVHPVLLRMTPLV